MQYLSAGYEVYYKTRDHIAFSDTSITSWLGNTYDTATKKFSIPNTYTPDPAVSSRHTQSLSHTLALRTNYRISEWCKVSGGWSYVVAGKNCPQTIQAHLSCVVAFFLTLLIKDYI